jgi:hypothetical protein
VVHAEFEAATVIIRHGLARLGCADDETEEYLDVIRAERYRREPIVPPVGEACEPASA